MIKTQTTATITNIDGFYCNWSDGLEMSLSNGDKVNVPLTLGQMKQLVAAVNRRIEQLEERQLKDIRKQLEEADAEPADSTY